jgi:nicotinamidase-related amidase
VGGSHLCSEVAGIEDKGTTILFAGVNTDQCVLHSLTDANFLGYGCLLVEDCCATTSPTYCVEATVFNVKKCFGLVTDSSKLIDAISRRSKAAR